MCHHLTHIAGYSFSSRQILDENINKTRNSPGILNEQRELLTFMVKATC
jgi:hypothetical protein